MNKNRTINDKTSRVPNCVRSIGFISLLNILVVPVLFLMLVTVSVLGQTDQTEERMLKKISFEKEPVEFVSFSSDGKVFRPNEKFRRHNDWLECLTIRFKNISPKPIVYLSLALLFPETTTADPPIVHFLKYGTNPLLKSISDKDLAASNENGVSARLLPEDTSELVLTSETLSQLKNSLAARRPLSELTYAEFQIMVVYFEDGTQWSAGTFARPDPERPGKFIAIKNYGGKNNE